LDEKTKLDELINIGIALANETRLDKLLEKIVEEARSFTNADAGGQICYENCFLGDPGICCRPR